MLTLPRAPWLGLVLLASAGCHSSNGSPGTGGAAASTSSTAASSVGAGGMAAASTASTAASSSGAGGSGPCSSGLAFAAPIKQLAASFPNALVVADLDGDGKLDVATANDEQCETIGSVSVLLGHGDGTLAAPVRYPLSGLPTEIASGDLNGDGKPDLVVTVASSLSPEAGNTLGVLMNKGDGTFFAEIDYAVGMFPQGVAVADVNGDGKPDVVIADHAGASVSVLLNQGGGALGGPADYPTDPMLAPVTVAVGDLDGDGKPDIVVGNFVASGNGSVVVLMNQGNGTFGAAIDVPAGENPQAVALADLNGDGKLDIAVANTYGMTVGVLLNQGNGTFAAEVEYPIGTQPLRLAIGDLDGDGKPDIVAGSDVATQLVALLNAGGGTFGAPVSIDTEVFPVNLAIADMNGDGKPDLVDVSFGTGNVDVLLDACQ